MMGRTETDNQGQEREQQEVNEIFQRCLRLRGWSSLTAINAACSSRHAYSRTKRASGDHCCATPATRGGCVPRAAPFSAGTSCSFLASLNSLLSVVSVLRVFCGILLRPLSETVPSVGSCCLLSAMRAISSTWRGCGGRPGI